MTTTSRPEPSDTRGRTTAVGDATRTRLMQAAERLIAERGVDAVSVRDITAAADTNSASIHYHFQSKEGLIHAIMEDRAERLGERRGSYLQALGPDAPSVRAVAEAIVNPTFEFVSGHEEESDTAYVGFLAALLDDPTMVPALERYFANQYDAYFDALRRARPDLEEGALVNRVCFALHLVLNTVSEPARGLRTWIERHYPPAVDTIRQDLIDFLTGAFEAP
ncbi:MAG TPA: TetR family transcriptional regulator [Acidimicrobiales bacterium]|nr:TetR family transcriptional regulator [Acidimicrobiales bacterium]